MPAPQNTAQPGSVTGSLSPNDPASYTCPHCSAAPQQQCRSPKSKARDLPHEARFSLRDKYMAAVRFAHDAGGQVEWGVIWDAYTEEPGRVWTEGVNGPFGSREAVEWEIRARPHQQGHVVSRTVTPWVELPS